MVGRKMAGRSKIWLLSHFVDDRRAWVQCNLCPVKIKYVGNTTNVARHLEVKHPQEYNTVSQLIPSTRLAHNTASTVVTSPKSILSSKTHSTVRNITLQEQLKLQKEELAIRRILKQHKLERLKAESAGTQGEELKDLYSDEDTEDYPTLREEACPTSLWAWHSPMPEGNVCS